MHIGKCLFCHKSHGKGGKGGLAKGPDYLRLHGFNDGPAIFFYKIIVGVGYRAQAVFCQYPDINFIEQKALINGKPEWLIDKIRV